MNLVIVPSRALIGFGFGLFLFSWCNCLAPNEAFSSVLVHSKMSTETVTKHQLEYSFASHLKRSGGYAGRPVPFGLKWRSRHVSTNRVQHSSVLHSSFLFFGDIIEAVKSLPEDFDLAFGMFVIFCAVTPYFLGLFFPDFLYKEFFIPVYGDDAEDDGPGRRAEIAWKCLYATQGLTLTSIIFAETVLDNGTKEALRDCYVAWALFYIVAIIKIRKERDIIKLDSRFGVQLWHSFVAVALLLDVGLRPDVVETVGRILDQ